MQISRRFLTVLAAASLIAALGVSAMVSANTVVTTSHGTWTAHPGQSMTYAAAVQQPINADGGSNFKANGKTVIPIKFALSQETGAFVFESIYSDNTTDPSTNANDNSYLLWDPATTITFADITELSAVYAFTDGDCAGGSLRWTVNLVGYGNVDIHYQPGENGLGDQYCKAGTSGANLIGSTDTIYVTYSPNLGYNVDYADAVAELGSYQVNWMNLVVDSGWGANGDQVVDLTSATVGVGGSSPYTETFTPQPASAMTAVCPTAEATISISKVDGTPSGAVNEPLTVQPQDNNGIFRIVDCKYMYNLATSSLSGVGTYTVSATIGGTAFVVGSFDLK